MMNENDKDDEHELNKIRMQKMRAIMEQKKRKEQMEQQSFSLQDKVDFVLRTVLEQDAYQRLNYLKQNEPQVYQYIFNELVDQEVLHRIDYLIALIRQQGGVPRRIPQDVIVYLERQAKGIKSQIKVKRGDETLDLGSYLTKK